MIEEILSPDLRLQRRKAEAQRKRLEAARHFKIGDRVRAGNGCPGILEKISEEGLASIRWSDGSLLCGVETTDLQHA